LPGKVEWSRANKGRLDVPRIEAKRSTGELTVEAQNASPITRPGLLRFRYWALVAAACLLISQPNEAAAQCATTGSAPVTFTCATNTTTVNATNSTSSNPSTNASGQTFADSIVGQVNSGVAVSGQGLQILSSNPGSTVSFTNNGTVSPALSPHALALSTALGGTGSITYSGSGNITQTGAGDALFFNSAAGAGSATITIKRRG
jgi:hypothetical protein